MQILSYYLILLALLAPVALVNAQQLFSTELGVPNSSAQDLIILPGGDLISAGHRNSQLQLVRWSPQGDTIWVKEYPISIPAFPEERREEIRLLSTGEILLTTLNGSSLFDVDGNWISSIDLRGMHVLELGPDSLLACTADSIFVKDRIGNLIWERKLVRPDQNWLQRSRVGSFSSGFMILSSQIEAPQDPTSGSLQIGRYLKSGQFVDTLTIASSNVGYGATGLFDMTGTSDGGSICTSVLFSTFKVIRLTNDGDTLWVRSFSPFTLPEPGIANLWPSGEVIELMNGNILISGWAFNEGGSRSSAIAELDAQGSLLCLERVDTLSIASASFRSAIGQGADNKIYLLSGYGSTAPEMKASLTGYYELCIPTSVNEELANTSCAKLRAYDREGQITLDLSTCQGPVYYSVIDATGRVLNSGSNSGSKAHIDLGFDVEGLVMVRVVEVNSGRTSVIKTVVY